MSGRQGPVHLTIPHDYQSATVDASAYERYAPKEYSTPSNVLADPSRVQQAVQLLNSAERPLIMAGSSAGATADPEVVQQLVETTRVPFVSEDSARALIPDSHPYSIGLGYLPLNRAAQMVREADVVMMLGKRLDYTLGFGGTPPFHPNSKVIVVDPSAAEIGRSRSAEIAILGDLGPVCEQLAAVSEGFTWSNHAEWVDSLRQTHDEWLAELYEMASPSTPMHPMYVSETLQKFLDDDAHITFDGGDYCHFLRASIPREKPFRFHNVSSFGMIGVGIAYGLGAQVALPDTQCVVATGDGSFGFNGMELDTMVRHRLPVKILLGNNSIWGIDWQIQKGIYGRPVWTDLAQGTRYDLVAKGLGAYGEHVTAAEQLEPAIERAFTHDGPALLNIEVDQIISPVAEAAIDRKLGSHG